MRRIPAALMRRGLTTRRSRPLASQALNIPRGCWRSTGSQSPVYVSEGTFTILLFSPDGISDNVGAETVTKTYSGNGLPRQLGAQTSTTRVCLPKQILTDIRLSISSLFPHIDGQRQAFCGAWQGFEANPHYLCFTPIFGLRIRSLPGSA